MLLIRPALALDLALPLEPALALGQNKLLAENSEILIFAKILYLKANKN